MTGLLLTGSAYGFFGEVLYTSANAPYLKTHAITNIARDDATRRFYDDNEPAGMVFTNLKTLFGAALETGRTVYANDPGADPRRGGLPPRPSSIERVCRCDIQRLGHENSTTQGSGIGLVISKKLVEMMNGRIGFISEPGMGSTFWFELPSATMAIAEKIAGATVTPPEQNSVTSEPVYTILYVEDNPANLRFMERLIGTRANTRLISAHEPQLGLELANAHHPDLILLDINLPGLDGYEVLQRLRAHGQTHDIPVIAVTANVMPREVERGNAAGFNGYITKPINVPQFLQLVNDTLHQRGDHPLN